MNRRKIKVLHVGISQYLGGIETYLLKIATYSNKEVFQYDFLSYHGITPCFTKELMNMGCKFFYITPRKKNYVKFIYDLKKLYEREKYDIVHCHLNSLSSIEPCLVALKSGSKVIVHARNAANMVSFHSKLLHHINYHLLPKGRICCAAVSDLAGEWMFGKDSRFIVLNNGLDTDRYRFNEISRKEVREKLNIDDNREVIMHIGAFRTQKNHTFLIDVFKEYLDKFPSALLLLVGDGELKEAIKEKVARLKITDSVLFLGRQNDIPQLLSAADKFLFPSFYEGFPNALLEAETAGLLCVVADSITRQAMIGDLCTCVSLDDPIDKWVSALGQPHELTKRVNAAELIKKAGLDISSEMKRLFDVYIKLVNNDDTIYKK